MHFSEAMLDNPQNGILANTKISQINKLNNQIHLPQQTMKPDISRGRLQSEITIKGTSPFGLREQWIENSFSALTFLIFLQNRYSSFRPCCTPVRSCLAHSLPSTANLLHWSRRRSRLGTTLTTFFITRHHMNWNNLQQHILIENAIAV